RMIRPGSSASTAFGFLRIQTPSKGAKTTATTQDAVRAIATTAKIEKVYSPDPKGHLLRRINVFVTSVLGDLHEQLGPFYSAIGRPSIDPELLIRMLIVGYCFGIRSERKRCEEVKLHLASRWFCRLDLNAAIPHHSTFSENRLNRFRESDILRHIFERVVMAAMGMGLVKGEGFAVDASVMGADASRYEGKAPDELDWTEKQRQKC